MIIIEEVFFVWVRTDLSLGGLGFASEEIGYLMSICGFILLIYQAICYPILGKKYGARKLFISGCAMLVPVAIGIPLLRSVWL
jgi:hypothetical protein